MLFIGTINKEYPKTVGGFAFNMGNNGVPRIFSRVNPSSDIELTTVCAKDSQDITTRDR